MKLFCGFTCSAAVLSLLGALAAPARDAASAQTGCPEGHARRLGDEELEHRHLHDAERVRRLDPLERRAEDDAPQQAPDEGRRHVQRAPRLLRTDGGQVRNGGRDRERRADDDVRAAVPAAARACRLRARPQARERRGASGSSAASGTRSRSGAHGSLQSRARARASRPPCGRSCRGCTRPKVGSPRRSSRIPGWRVRRRSAARTSRATSTETRRGV